MITNEREQKICDKYGAYDETGHVHCDECPLVKGNWRRHDFRCKANSHYDRKTRDWEYDEWESGEIMTNEEAIKNLQTWLSKGTEGMTNKIYGYLEGWFHEKDKEAFNMAIKALQQKPKAGHWIEYKGYDTYSCSECDEYVDKKSRYCPNCGAKMGSEG